MQVGSTKPERDTTELIEQALTAAMMGPEEIDAFVDSLTIPNEVAQFGQAISSLSLVIQAYVAAWEKTRRDLGIDWD
jgi:hypothetical protein